MKRIASVVLAAVAVAAVVVPSSASARGSKMLMIKDCKKQTATVLVPQEQAQALLPKGFTATGGPNGNEEAVWLYFITKTCGSEASPTLETFESHVGVHPPKKYANKQGSDFYQFDLGVEGSKAAAFAKHVCMTDVIDEAQIDASVTTDGVSPAAVADAAAEIEGPVTASMTVRGLGFESESSGLTRMFYTGGSKPRFYDYITGQSYFSMGQSTITFAEPYLGLQTVNASLGLVQLQTLVYERPKSCLGK